MIKQRGRYRDDLKFWCSDIYDDHIFLHHFVYYLSLGLPLTKTAYTQWRSTCATKQLEVGMFVFDTKGAAESRRLGDKLHSMFKFVVLILKRYVPH